ncbi:MAG TPA: hypothetical protein P5556_00485 [Candidatus Gastranaerophilales bacterium]|nr:hypothetical protein [Candidatus Gastranaerophilales bacterium]
MNVFSLLQEWSKKNSKKILIAIVLVVVVAGLIKLMPGAKVLSDKELMTVWKTQYEEAKRFIELVEMKNINDSLGEKGMLMKFKSNMNFIKEDKWSNLAGTVYNYYKNPSKSYTFLDEAEYKAVELKDGGVWGFKNYPDCSHIVGNLKNICAEIIVDVNGKNKPNMFGKDLFFVWVGKTKDNYFAFPKGSNDDGITCVSESSEYSTSAGCSAHALLNKSIDDMP